IYVLASCALGLQPHQFTVPEVAEPPLPPPSAAGAPPVEHAAIPAAVTDAIARAAAVRTSRPRMVSLSIVVSKLVAVVGTLPPSFSCDAAADGGHGGKVWASARGCAP